MTTHTNAICILLQDGEKEKGRENLSKKIIMKKKTNKWVLFYFYKLANFNPKLMVDEYLKKKNREGKN